MEITCSELTVETLEQSVKYVQSPGHSCSNVSIVNLEQVNVSWETLNIKMP